PSYPATMSTISPTDYDSMEIQQQYNDINNRWDLAAEQGWDNENSSARLFERSRIKALAGESPPIPTAPLTPELSHSHSTP
ncbi:SPTB2 protein, partial [Polyodon spathula]|nr:SPTB2 protein [Polyodon spathula]